MAWIAYGLASVLSVVELISDKWIGWGALARVLMLILVGGSATWLGERRHERLAYERYEKWQVGEARRNEPSITPEGRPPDLGQ
ncbi:MAG TPA: hypothetical protein VK646_02850 [Actinomycetota bacterium]|nr:hypothetical protein [Actinomycetota bacterium]